MFVIHNVPPQSEQPESFLCWILSPQNVKRVSSNSEVKPYGKQESIPDCACSSVAKYFLHYCVCIEPAKEKNMHDVRWTPLPYRGGYHPTKFIFRVVDTKLGINWYQSCYQLILLGNHQWYPCWYQVGSQWYRQCELSHLVLMARVFYWAEWSQRARESARCPSL